jgi:protein-S-isoprenylcysteine O-methyltransferase Ste14
MITLRKIAIYFILLQSAAVAVWWIVICIDPPFRSYFLLPNSPDANLLAFLLPDSVLYFSAALLAAYGLSRKEDWAWPMLCVSTGAIVYAGLYAVGLMVFSGGYAWMGAILMFPPMIIMSLLAFQLHPEKENIPLKLSTQLAAPASNTWNIIKTMIQSFFFWLTFLFFVPALIYFVERSFGKVPGAFESLTGQIIGGLLFTIGGILCLMSGIYMAVAGKGTPLPIDCPNELVVVGPYKYVRNPMAIAAIFQGIAVGIFLGSWIIIVYSFLGGLLWHILIRPWEEKDLEKRFGKKYLTYKNNVKCWVPRLTGFVKK